MDYNSILAMVKSQHPEMKGRAAQKEASKRYQALKEKIENQAESPGLSQDNTRNC